MKSSKKTFIKVIGFTITFTLILFVTTRLSFTWWNNQADIEKVNQVETTIMKQLGLNKKNLF